MEPSKEYHINNSTIKIILDNIRDSQVEVIVNRPLIRAGLQWMARVQRCYLSIIKKYATEDELLGVGYLKG